MSQAISHAVLIVDDDAAICKIVSRTLEANGYRCVVADSAEGALELLDHDGFSLVICDVLMPGLSGLEFLERIRYRFREALPVIMMTGMADKKTVDEIIERGAYNYLHKPLDLHALAVNVKLALKQRRFSLQAVRSQSALAEKVQVAQEEIGWRLLRAAEWRDEETGAHVQRVGLGSQMMAQKLGWEPRAVSDMKLAAAMHDIGKIGVPDRILLKPGRLTREEFEVVKSHTEIGHSILGGASSSLLMLAAEIALSHHEKWDGSGYPRGLVGEEIPESGRIVAIIDVYDALISDRSYRKAFAEEKAIESMSGYSGQYFDPSLFGVFLGILPEFRARRANGRLFLTSPSLARPEPSPPPEEHDVAAGLGRVA